MAGSNTTTKQRGGVTGKGFAKGDPRINRNGRPKSFDQLRALAQQIAHETAKAGGNTVVIDGHSVTVAEAVLRQWFQSKDFQKQRAAIEIAFGKVPQAVTVQGDDEGGPVRVEHNLAGLDAEELKSLALIVAKLERRTG